MGLLGIVVLLAGIIVVHKERIKLEKKLNVIQHHE